MFIKMIDTVRNTSEIFYPDAVTNIRIAMKQLRSGRLLDSVKWFKRAVELDESNASARFGLGYALFYSGDFKGALEQYRRGLAIAPDNIAARSSLAAVSRKLFK